MQIAGKQYRTIWIEGSEVSIIDQRQLPFELVIEKIRTADQMATAIREMHVRGAPLIGVAAAAGAYLAACEIAACYSVVDRKSLEEFNLILKKIQATRPTAVNLIWALEQQRKLAKPGLSWNNLCGTLLHNVKELAEQDVKTSESIGQHGIVLIEQIAAQKRNTPVQILTHCNAGWLCSIDYGTATAPIYAAHRAGIPLHVWVDETRPRLQGARLTAFELAEEGIPHTLITDNTGGHLMQHGEVDLCIVGTDRTTRTGDVANKIGTYLKALAAHDNRVPFYVAAPSSSIDWSLRDGVQEILIEERHPNEVLYVEGLVDGVISEVRIAPENSPAKNFGFDVTPSRLITGIITERGVCKACEEELCALFPDQQ